MGRKLSDDRIEELIETSTASQENLPSILAESEDDALDFQLGRSMDDLLKASWKEKPVRLPSKLQNFSLKTKKTQRFFTLPKIAPIAAAILVVLIAALWMVLSTAPPTGDKAKIDTLVTAATDTTQSPSDLRSAQKEFLTYLSEYYGSYIELRNASKLPDFDSDYRSACKSYETKALKGLATQTDVMTRIETIEKVAEACDGLISTETVELYRQNVTELIAKVESTISDWRNNAEVDNTWMVGQLEPARRIFESSAEANSKEVYLAWRALLDGVPKVEIAERFSAVPKNLKLQLAVLASQVVAYKLRYHTELIDNPDILSLAAKSLADDFESDPDKTARVVDVFSALPLWATFFEHRKAIPPRLRKLFDNVESMFIALDGDLSRNRIDTMPIVSAFRNALGANDKFFLNSTANAPQWRTANLMNGIASFSNQSDEELVDFVSRANLMRMLLDRNMISIVFECNTDFERVETSIMGLRSSSPNISAFREVFFGNRNCLMPLFKGSGDTSRVEMLFFSQKDGPFLPQNYISIKEQKKSPAQMTSGDAPGKF